MIELEEKEKNVDVVGEDNDRGHGGVQRVRGRFR
jgi:hypothetical protein